MQGQLFSYDFLSRGVLEIPPSQVLDAQTLAAFEQALHAVFAPYRADSQINEAQTESEIIYPVLELLGWQGDYLPQVNLSGRRREDVPDCLLFGSASAKASALQESKDHRRYRHGLAILEAKRWLRPLDRGDASEAYDPDAPSSQMLRYLSRADVESDRAVKWGVLTNGAVWRLYWQDARSRAEEFFEINLAAALGLPGVQTELDELAPQHLLRLFYVFFHRDAFLPQAWVQELPDASGQGVQRLQTLHAYARNEARLYEERVSQDLGARVFAEVFPQLADALARGDLEAEMQDVGIGQFRRRQFTPQYLEQVREAALVLLYRLLFLFYAEDRNLLPVRDPRYAPYSVRRLREEVRDKLDAGGGFSSTMPKIWLSLRGVFGLIDEGDDDIGMPAYNGGLFSWGRSPVLNRTKVPDKVMAPLIDALSRRTEEVLRGWINYRDLAVSHLGSIYERLLEYSLVHQVQAQDSYKDKPEINRVIAVPASFARKVSGSYYTHDDLVALILNESVGQLAQDRMDAFELQLAAWAQKKSLGQAQWNLLDGNDEEGIATLDPASRMLELKVCDPAMGSGHFLVALVDHLADRILEAINSATQRVNAQPWAAHLVEQNRPWQSPLVARIAAIRAHIKATARQRGWAVTDAQLDDRHIVRRMVLKKSIYGVDKNPMAVELAKTALWLHTFTVGAPLSFLDHHLKVGDSLHGERLPQVQRDLQNLGALLLQNEFDRLARAASSLAQVAEQTDADIAEAKLSQQLAAQADAELAPLHAVLDFWRALRWLIPGWPVAKVGQLATLLKLPKTEHERQAQLAAGQHPEYAALLKLLEPGNNLVQLLGAGQIPGTDAASQAANALLQRARALAAQETFFHWWTQFPTVFGGNAASASALNAAQGFDAVIGNPPWDRIKLQEVEWFAERNPHIAAQPRAADRKAMIAALQHVNMVQTGVNTPPVQDLWPLYQAASARAEANARVLGNGKQGSGDYPLLGGGDVNLYSLFVERAQSLIQPGGIVALITPSGIAADKGAADFFRSISSTGKLHALFDFENRKVFFPDVDSRFKFCALVFGKTPRMAAPAEQPANQPVHQPANATLPPPSSTAPQEQASETLLPVPSRCAFYLHSTDELAQPERVLRLSAQDFARVNPNTGAAPIFRTQRDADITLRLYAQHPVLVQHGKHSDALGQLESTKAWPVKYVTMFHMTNDSRLFLKPQELAQQGWKRSALNRWKKGQAQALPLYEGKMVQMFDHRAADVVVNEANLKRAAQQEAISPAEKDQASRYPEPQYWVDAKHVSPVWNGDWCLAYKSVTAPSNMRTMIAALIPQSGVGNSMALLLPDSKTEASYARWAPLLLANLNSMAFDFALRQKVQGQNLNWFIVEQATVIAPHRFDEPLPAAFVKAMRRAQLMNGHHARPSVADFVLPQVLALSYTAHDMAPLARDMGYVDASGTVLPPFAWDEAQRRERLAGLDAVFFYLYGLNPEDARYILNSFPIVREQDTRIFGSYRTQEDVLRWLALLVE